MCDECFCIYLNSWTALMLASDQGHTEIVNLLLQFGASPMLSSNDGCSAMSLARENQYADITKLLATSLHAHAAHAMNRANSFTVQDSNSMLNTNNNISNNDPSNRSPATDKINITNKNQM